MAAALQLTYVAFLFVCRFSMAPYTLLRLNIVFIWLVIALFTRLPHTHSLTTRNKQVTIAVGTVVGAALLALLGYVGFGPIAAASGFRPLLGGEAQALDELDADDTQLASHRTPQSSPRADQSDTDHRPTRADPTLSQQPTAD